MAKIHPKVDQFPRRHLLAYIFCLAGDVVAGLLILLQALLVQGRVIWQGGFFCLVPKDSWWFKTVAKGLAGGAIGHHGWYRADLVGKDGIDTKLEFHEHIHVEQFEVASAFAFIVLSILSLVLAVQGAMAMPVFVAMVILWALSGLLYTSSSWLVAYLRGEPVYEGSSHEEAAYALEKFYKKGKK